MRMNVFHYFTDPVLRAPTLGSMFMCLAAALVGVIVFLRKQSLLGESLSHAAYPGVILGVICAGILHIGGHNEVPIALLIMSGAFLSSMAGLKLIGILERKWNVRTDSALCFVLSTFFGIGLTLASQVQFSFTSLYRQIQVYLYGQAATMTDIHVVIYGVLSFAISAILLLFYKEIQVMIYDRSYAKTIGINTKPIDFLLFLLIVLAVVIGIRSVGVVLMSAMLIAPAAAARQYTNKLYAMLGLSACFGVASGFLGNVLSIEITTFLIKKYPATRLVLPTGPMIVLVASFLCVVSLLFAPKRGLILRLARAQAFRHHCLCENILKSMWRFGPDQEITFAQIKHYQSVSTIYLHILMLQLIRNGWIQRAKSHRYCLTKEGASWAAHIVRLHRLWEVYLADYLGVGSEKVHHSAEQMEHIITPELERELTLLLKNPDKDPHDQPIPRKEL